MAASGLIAVAACDSGEVQSPKGDGAASSSGTTTSGGGSSNSSSFGGSSTSSGQPADGGKPDVVQCVDQAAGIVESTRPVDIIFAIDNSDSMAARIAAVEAQINTNFAGIIAASGLDYRVIMLSNHGRHVDPVDPNDPLQRICVKAPLSGTDCNPIPPVPAETEHFKQHNIVINSTDSWCQILTSFHSPDKDGNHLNGWSEFLRADAFKTFVVITDDQIVTQCNPFNSPTPLKFDDLATDLNAGANAAGSFDSALLALAPTQFGSSTARNYVWHSIVGLAPYDANDLTKAWPPSAPMTQAQCTPNSVTPGTGYQGLSKLTGGLRYPICGNDYTTIFQAMANDVIKRSHVSCEYAVPDNPDGGTIDRDTAVVRYIPGDVSAQDQNFLQVKDLASCTNDKQFYIESGVDGGKDKIKLCPTTCTKVSADEGAKVKILFGCVVPPDPPPPGTHFGIETPPTPPPAP